MKMNVPRLNFRGHHANIHHPTDQRTCRNEEEKIPKSSFASPDRLRAARLRPQWVVTVMTLTLKAGALKVNDLPVVMLLVFGVTLFGAAGVLLAVCAPVSCCSVPVPATVLNWLKSKVRLAVALPAFATWAPSWKPSVSTSGMTLHIRGSWLALMNVSPELEERVMLQCSVLPLVGSVEARYWSPTLVAKSCVQTCA